MKRLSLNSKQNSRNKLENLNVKISLVEMFVFYYVFHWDTLNLKAFIHPPVKTKIWVVTHQCLFLTYTSFNVNHHSLPTFTFLYKCFYYVSYLFAPVHTIFPELNIRAVVLGSRILMITAANRWENKKMQKTFTKCNDWQKILRQYKMIIEVWKRDKLMPCESL